MYTLYSSSGSCSRSIHVLLNELDVPYALENISISKGENRTPAYLAINSRGQVPVLKDGKEIIREGAAIISYLADKHPTSLLPQDGPARVPALEWMMFANATLHPAYGRFFFACKTEAVKDDARDALKEAVAAQIQNLWNDVEAQLTRKRYCAGDAMTIADIMLTVMSAWGKSFGLAIKFGPKCQALFDEIGARPAFQKALAVEAQADQKAAA
ncbi:MAG: glutathione S-transferase family protein [Pseudobdellovibrionaceae bacterium]